ncbi:MULTISPECIES: helix-turn-helix domain-containing protein [unclassified Streptomyces]|uniref:AraC-like ligand-binding domain-containing protein n=1 Tax=unclassified Streptomyces TaxID=2593676 RepID=UPI00081D7EA4|nr:MULTISPECIES: helix-turn-helix domain-containing protein [unclassified Streptomyces]MYZ37246.1 helix-turn-helix domain-containing protein [Streptomyces sp. SID4917]SCF89923.1 AraC-type DNA-binding protein [Streptomyces sp. MnatMP-M17]
MLVTEFSTEVVAASERFELFTEITDRLYMINRLRSNDQDDFRARMRVLDLGELQVSTMHFPHLEITRTPKLIRQYDPEAYQINYFLRQEGVLSTGSCDTALRAGDLVLMDSSRPYRGEVHAVLDSWSHVTVQFSRRLLPLPDKTVQALLGAPIDGRRGMGGAFARWLTDLSVRADEFTSADIPVLASATLDLLGSVVARCLDAEEAMSPDARRRALEVRIHDFIQQRLADPGLTPEAIAAAHGISTRYLYKLFYEQGLTVAGWIRECRLERCCRDLTDPSLSSRSIQAIASRWGFIDKAHFSRVFRAAYGISPRDYRHLGAHRHGVQEPSTTVRGRSTTPLPPGGMLSPTIDRSSPST